MRGREVADRLWSAAVSMRTSAVLLAVFATLMLANVAIPQESTTPEAYRALVGRGEAWRFAVETLGLGNVSTSAPFRITLALFFTHLAAVLVDRAGATVRRARVRPPTEAQFRAMLERDALAVAAEPGWSPAGARRVLEALGYRVAEAGAEGLWGVKNPAAVLGFPLFHASFFILCVAGMQLYLTRDVAVALAIEGQRIRSEDLSVVRRSPQGAPPPVDLVLDSLAVELKEGSPTGLAAALRPLIPGEPAREARVNFPAEWGDLSVLVERVGVAPVLRLEDVRGFTLDRVSVAVGGQDGAPTTVTLAGGAVQVTLEPIPVGPAFPMRDALPHTRLRARVLDGTRLAFDGSLAPGERVAAGGATLAIEELRYWTSLRFVHERGGPLLVFGFAVLVAGIVWRLVWYRREVAIGWGGGGVRLSGRSEFYPARFRDELGRLRGLLEDPGRLGRGGAKGRVG